MQTQKLIRMANQIGAFFEAEPDAAAAVEGVIGHIRRFWDPRMRVELLRWLEEGEGEGLSPLVIRALKARGGSLLPRH